MNIEKKCLKTNLTSENLNDLSCRLRDCYLDFKRSFLSHSRVLSRRTKRTALRLSLESKVVSVMESNFRLLSKGTWVIARIYSCLWFFMLHWYLKIEYSSHQSARDILTHHLFHLFERDNWTDRYYDSQIVYRWKTRAHIKLLIWVDEQREKLKDDDWVIP